MRVLIVEDNLDLIASIADYLDIYGCECDLAYNGEMGLELALINEYDVYVFDIAMPKRDGLSLCKTLRDQYNNQTPVLFLTARDTIDDKLKGFEVGADDYLVKPFDLKELLVRLKAIFKRTINRSNILTIGDLVLNVDTQEVKRKNDTINLSPFNFKLLLILLQKSPQVVSREELEHFVWADDLPDSDSLRSHIYKLRQVIDKPYSKKLIHTVKGQGFRISS